MGGIVSTGRTTHYRPGQCAIYVTTCKISCTLLAKVQATSCAEECEAAAYHHPYIHIGIQAQLALCSSQGSTNVANIYTKSSVLTPATTATFMLCKLQLTKVPNRCAKSLVSQVFVGMNILKVLDRGCYCSFRGYSYSLCHGDQMTRTSRGPRLSLCYGTVS